MGTSQNIISACVDVPEVRSRQNQRGIYAETCNEKLLCDPEESLAQRLGLLRGKIQFEDSLECLAI